MKGCGGSKTGSDSGRSQAPGRWIAAAVGSEICLGCLPHR